MSRREDYNRLLEARGTIVSRRVAFLDSGKSKAAEEQLAYLLKVNKRIGTLECGNCGDFKDDCGCDEDECDYCGESSFGCSCDKCDGCDQPMDDCECCEEEDDLF